MPSIGIVGAGVSALHLALYLRRHGVAVTLYTDRSGEEIATGRLMNTVAHHRATLAREAELGIDHHWPVATHGYQGHLHWFGFPEPLVVRGDFVAPSRAIDYRIYQPQLMTDAAESGAEIHVGPVDLAAVAAEHDLVVVATGRGSELSALFPPRPERTAPAPWRRLTAALYRGIGRADPHDVVLSVSPGAGEIIQLPILSFEGPVTALLIEAVPGGELDAINACRYDDDPGTFTKLVLELLARHAPMSHDLVDLETFAVTRPQDVLQGAVTPCLRQDWTQLPDGTCAVALGDAHSAVDPIVAQGANSGSWSAFVVGEEIVRALGSSTALDAAFCDRVAARRADYFAAMYDWIATMLAPPTPQLVAITVGMAMNKAVCDEFTDNFSFPDRQWAALESMDATRAHLARFGLDADAILASLSPPPN